MRSVPILVGAACAGLLAAGTGAAGQISPLSVEIRMGGSLPLEEFSETKAEWPGAAGEGFAFGLDFSYAPRWWLAPYVGFSQMRFSCSAGGCGRETDLISTGFDAGARVLFHPGRIAPWLRAGFITYRVEGLAPGLGGVEGVVSDRSVGFEAGAGVAIRIRPNLVLSPGVRYAGMSPGFDGLGSLTMRYLVADMGLVLGF